MVKHIFIAPIKENVSEDSINKRIMQMKELKKQVPEIKNLMVEKATGWLGVSHTVVLVAELDSQKDWEIFVNNEYHKELGKTDDLYFKVEEFVCVQIEGGKSNE